MQKNIDKSVVKRKYKELLNQLESSPDKDEIIKFWSDHSVDILSYLRFQFLDENNILPLAVLKPKANKILKIRLKGLEYYVPMKDIAHMGDGNREPWLIKELSSLSTGDIFFDIGANLGQFTVPIGKKARVFAFEPEEQTYKYLGKNIELNNIAKNVTLIKAIVSDRTGKTQFYTSELTSLFSGILDPNEYILGWTIIKKTEIPTTTVDIIVDEYKLDRIDWMKIDVEGAEFLVLKGCSESISKGLIKNILIEMHPTTYKGTTQEDIYEFLSKFYSIKVLWRDENNPAFHYLKASLK
jgi:FkbM family methyltransferase